MTLLPKTTLPVWTRLKYFENIRRFEDVPIEYEKTIKNTSLGVWKIYDNVIQKMLKNTLNNNLIVEVELQLINIKKYRNNL